MEKNLDSDGDLTVPAFPLRGDDYQLAELLSIFSFKVSKLTKTISTLILTNHSYVVDLSKVM